MSRPAGERPAARELPDPPAQAPPATASAERRARIEQWAGGRPQGLVALALVIGVGGGLGAIAFRYMIEGVTELATGRSDPSAIGRVVNLTSPRSAADTS
jgi:CIC family chloride channel protein